MAAHPEVTIIDAVGVAVFGHVAFVCAEPQVNHGLHLWRQVFVHGGQHRVEGEDPLAQGQRAILLAEGEPAAIFVPRPCAGDLLRCGETFARWAENQKAHIKCPPSSRQQRPTDVFASGKHSGRRGPQP